MDMKKRSFLIAVFIVSHLFVIQTLFAQKSNNKPDKALVKTFEKNFKDAAAQYKVLRDNLPAEKFPKTFFPETGKYEFSNSGWWCSGR